MPKDLFDTFDTSSMTTSAEKPKAASPRSRILPIRHRHDERQSK